MKMFKQEKTKLVNSVFKEVYKKYDLMNDIMSLGIHRLWKRDLLYWMSPNQNQDLIDVASGTGDIAMIYSKKLNHQCSVSCVEPNKEMLKEGEKKLKNLSNINWYNSAAEKLPFKDDTFDYYTISFGLRNVSDINSALKEAYRVLKPGGRFFCLEFSKVENEFINYFYQKYSKILPKFGKVVLGNSAPYEYLVESIDRFYNQDDLRNLLIDNSLVNVEYRNVSSGIAAIHTGWKI
tara:strand:- start:802 stop:1506 length:705 start_codon:yes stop_codon:yes gene_type:complete